MVYDILKVGEEWHKLVYCDTPALLQTSMKKRQAVNPAAFFVVCSNSALELEGLYKYERFYRKTIMENITTQAAGADVQAAQTNNEVLTAADRAELRNDRLQALAEKLAEVISELHMLCAREVDNAR